MKRRLFLIAHSIKANFATFSEALKHAWLTVKLQVKLCLGVVAFKYKKLDGSIRQATGTNDHGQQLKGSDRPKNYGILTYFDTEVQAFRSAKIENLLFN